MLQQSQPISKPSSKASFFSLATGKQHLNYRIGTQTINSVAEMSTCVFNKRIWTAEFISIGISLCAFLQYHSFFLNKNKPVISYKFITYNCYKYSLLFPKSIFHQYCSDVYLNLCCPANRILLSTTPSPRLWVFALLRISSLVM